MAVTFIVNGEKQDYPEEIKTLEQLIETVKGKDNRVVVEVKVDDKTFSELYPHQSRDMLLKDLKTVEIFSQDPVEFTNDFLKQAPAIVLNIKQGFETAIKLMSDKEKSKQGYDIFVKSVEALIALRGHLHNSKDFLGDHTSNMDNLWSDFEGVVSRLVDAQKANDTDAVVSGLKEGMVPFLDRMNKELSDKFN